MLTFVLACSAPVREYACRTPADAQMVDATAVWDCNRDVIRRIVKGKRFTLEEFRNAAVFFEDLTGHAADTLSGPNGTVPGKGIEQDLKVWDTWHEKNGERLYWDRAVQALRVGG